LIRAFIGHDRWPDFRVIWSDAISVTCSRQAAKIDNGGSRKAVLARDQTPGRALRASYNTRDVWDPDL
jgi:hypothetical protein